MGIGGASSMPVRICLPLMTTPELHATRPVTTNPWGFGWHQGVERFASCLHSGSMVIFFHFLYPSFVHIVFSFHTPISGLRG
jgi:hypothetical protein